MWDADKTKDVDDDVIGDTEGEDDSFVIGPLIDKPMLSIRPPTHTRTSTALLLWEVASSGPLLSFKSKELKT
jgi:hypothetical protein